MERGTDTENIQRVLLSMIKDIHAVCAENGIAYSLTGGTLLGAVREAGFIPWDDDIDIMVDRKNYKRLCRAIGADRRYEMGRGPWLQHIRPVSHALETDPYIDVFILDHLPDSRIRSALKILLLRILQGMLKEEIEYEGFSFAYKACIFATHLAGKLFTRKFKLRLYDGISQIGNRSPARFISITNDSFGLLTKKHAAGLMDSFEEHPFEDTALMVIKKYREYLTVRYGPDYMSPPPENERIQGQHKNRPKVKNEKAGK